MLKGLTDKLYWRRSGASYCCFKKADGGGYVSLCQKSDRHRSGGQACARPPAYMRCAQCDIREMKRRGVEESMPHSPDWAEYGKIRTHGDVS